MTGKAKMLSSVEISHVKIDQSHRINKSMPIHVLPMGVIIKHHS